MEVLSGIRSIQRATLDFLRKFFAESSTHGFPYVARNDFHLIERTIWFGIIVFSFCGAYHVFSDQWDRFITNPTMLSIEIISEGEFERPSFTVCTNFTNISRATEIVESNWKISMESPKFPFYLDFVTNISSLTYKNMDDLQAFADIDDLNSADFLDIALRMKIDVPVPNRDIYSHVITERGICQSSSKYLRFLNPFWRDGTDNSPITHAKTCSSLEVCRTTVSPANLGPNIRTTVFINIFDEVMIGDGLDFVILHGTTIIERTQKVEQMFAEPKVIQFKPKSRKCLFRSESTSKYFDVYTVNLCKIDCRITRALSICGCIPFFYAIPMLKEKVCDIKGMLCLAEKTSSNSWYNVSTCDCPSLCETEIMTKMATKIQDLSFDRMLTLDISFPKIRIKRSVVFDFDDLIVGLGGSMAFFLGFSFLTGIEMLYFIIEYFLEVVITLIKSCVNKRDRISVIE